ncbi:MAG: hypothetical protein J6N45_07795 [Alphaproteobacteria bacterium]|nr:hypothetical protein [Alphaproteobacteria bacterium]
MNLFKILSIILALIMLANPAWCNDSQAFDTYTVSEATHHQNVDILKDYIIKFHARGGAYIVLDTETKDLVDKQFVGSVWEGFPIWSHNALRLFNYAVGFHSGTIKEDEKIIFNTGEKKLFDRVAKADREAYFKPYIVNDTAMPMSLLLQYIKLFKNADNYLTKTQLETLKSAVSDNVKTGKAKQANFEGVNVSGITSTTEKNKDGKEVYTVFLGDFEKDGKNYAIITLLDEPEALKFTYGFNSSGWNAAPLAAEIIKNISNK